MNRISLAAVSAISACLFATPAIASVIVIGNSPGHGCYVSAKAQNGSNVALEDCNKAMKSGLLSRDDTVATYVNRGIVKLWGKDHRGAVADFDRAIAMDPREAESYLNKGSAYLRMKASPIEAIALFSEALERKTDRPELAYFGRAIAHEVAGDMKAAYLDYRRAQAAAPEWGDPARELSRFQVRRVNG